MDNPTTVHHIKLIALLIIAHTFSMTIILIKVGEHNYRELSRQIDQVKNRVDDNFVRIDECIEQCKKSEAPDQSVTEQPKPDASGLYFKPCESCGVLTHSYNLPIYCPTCKSGH